MPVPVVRRRDLWFRAWTPWFVLALSLVATGVLTLLVTRGARQMDQLRFERWAQESVDDIEERVDVYVALLRGAAALFAASEEVTQEDFREYVERVGLDEHYPGVQGVGFATVVRPGEKEGVEALASELRGEAFEAWPTEPSEPRTTIVYLEPQDARNSRAIGFDMSSEPVRRLAMDYARDQGVPTMSGRVTLVQEDGESPKQAGFLLYVPVYQSGRIPATEDERRQDLIGFAFSPFRADDLFAHVFEEARRAYVEVAVYDGPTSAPEALLHRSHIGDSHASRFRWMQVLEVAGRQWTLVCQSRPQFERLMYSDMVGPATLAAGILASLLLFGVTFGQARSQAQTQRAAEELSRSEQELRELDERLQMALAAGNLFAFTWTLGDDRMSRIGNSTRVLGADPPTADAFAEMIHPDDRPTWHQSIARSLAGDGHHSLEFRIVTPDGQTRWLRDEAVVEFDRHGTARRMTGICADVTPTKHAEQSLRALNETLEQRVAERTLEAEQRSAQLRALAAELTQAEQRERRRLAQVLHDHLQQLLVAALMRMGGIRRKADDTVNTALDQVEDLIRQSIDASRSLTVELSPPVLYDAGLARALEWLARTMKDKHGLTVELAYEPEAEARNEDLRAFLFQAVRELLFNVVKHAKVPMARVTLGRDGEELVITVEDQGPGFDPSVLQAKGARAEHFGLFSIQQRLELLGGRLDIRSGRGGSGTRIRIRVPPGEPAPQGPLLSEILEDLPESEQYIAAEKLLQTWAAPASDTGAVRVLLADDHDVMRRGLGALLHTQRDIEVVGEAGNGEQVIEMVRTLRPDVVVMDVTMPRLDGVEATRRIIAEVPGVRVIALSMHEADGLADKMHDAGAFAYLMKTTNPDRLLEMIRKAGRAKDTPTAP